MPPPADHHFDEPTLHAYLDGELSATARRHAETHLANCAECTARAATLEHLFTSLETLPDRPLARDMAPTIVAALRHEAEARPVLEGRRLWWLGLQTVAAVMLLAFAWPALGQRWPDAAGAVAEPGGILQRLAWDTVFASNGRLGIEGLPGGAWWSGAPVSSAIDRLVDATQGNWMRMRFDPLIHDAWAPAAQWSSMTWAALLLALLPLWWLANRWLLRIELPQSQRSHDRRPA